MSSNDPSVSDIRQRIKIRMALNRLEQQTLKDERDWLDTMDLDLTELSASLEGDLEARRTFYNMIAKGA